MPTHAPTKTPCPIELDNNCNTVSTECVVTTATAITCSAWKATKGSSSVLVTIGSSTSQTKSTATTYAGKGLSCPTTINKSNSSKPYPMTPKSP